MGYFYKYFMDWRIKMDKLLSVKVYKYNRKLHYEWESKLIEDTEEYTLLCAYPGRKLIHHSKNKILEFNTYSIEFFPKKGWYTINVDVHKNGDIEYYCNICEQPIISEEGINFIDLDIDIVRDTNGNWSIVDQDEFLENSILMDYPESLKNQVAETSKHLFNLINNQSFPFDGFIEKQIDKLIKE